MVTVETLQVEVEAAYALTGSASWPNPHPNGREALDEEYSRLTDPQRSAILHARVGAWADVLQRRLGVDVAPWQSPGGSPEDDRFTRGVRLTSTRPGTLPLLLLEGDEPIPLVRVIGDDTELALLPDCGCDACDFGSEDLLEAVDTAITDWLVGPVVLLSGSDWSSRWSPEGASASHRSPLGDFDTVCKVSQRIADGEHVGLPPDTRVAVNRSWLA